MRKTLGAIALVLWLAAGVWVNSRLPAPHLKARENIWPEASQQPKSEEALTTTIYARGSEPISLLHPKLNTFLFPSLGREGSDFNELAKTLDTNFYKAIIFEPRQITHQKSNSAKDLNAASEPIIEALKWAHSVDRGTVLIGHAYGNRVIRMAAYQHPESVKGVILLAAGGQVPMEPKAEQSLKNIFNPLRSYKSRMKDVRYAFFAESNEVPKHWQRGWHTKTAMAQAKAVTASSDDDSWHCAGGVPMLIVQPMQDRIAPIENAYALKEKCPQDIEIVEVQNAGHALLPEQPEAVAKAVLDFLAKHHPIPPE